MTVRELYIFLDNKYPPELSCEWDNDGLMCSIDPHEQVKGVSIALDATESSIRFAESRGHNVLLTHHPMIFRGIKSINDSSITARRAVAAIKRGISVISLHTRLDSSKDGVNDSLAAVLGIENTEAFGNDDSPTLGRVGEIKDSVRLEKFASMAEEKLSAKARIYSGTGTVKRVAVVGGSGGDFVREAVKLGADTFLVGEISYHVALDASDEGLNVIEVGHFESENHVTEVLRSVLLNEAGIADVAVFNPNLNNE